LFRLNIMEFPVRAFFISTALFGFVASAFASDAASAPQAVAASGAALEAAAAPPQPKVVCRREMPTGSTIPRTVCHTESPSDEAQRAQTQNELADEARRNRMITVHSGG
jgi:predicted secreted protein